jgi:hypothetical protein
MKKIKDFLIELRKFISTLILMIFGFFYVMIYITLYINLVCLYYISILPVLCLYKFNIEKFEKEVEMKFLNLNYWVNNFKNNSVFNDIIYK